VINRVRQNEARQYLTYVASLLHTSCVPKANDFFDRVRDALVVDAKRQKEIRAQMNDLAEAHNRYLALQRESKSHEDSSNALKALLGRKAFDAVVKEDKSEVVGSETEWYPTIEQLREDASLWQHVQQYLRFMREAQVGEILNVLGWLEIETSRQAVESALKTHSRIFRIRKQGREKFVSLK
jgi:hypothetical protein